MISAEGQVAWADTDASGRIHFTAALRWVENAEHSLYRELGLEVGAYPRRSVSAEYIRPLAAGDRFTVQLKAERIGRSSIAWAWTVSVEDGPAITGTFGVVHVGRDGRSAPVPDVLRDRLAAPERTVA